MALLSGRMEVLEVHPEMSVRQLRLDAGERLQVSIATLSRRDGSQLEDMLTMEEAQLINGEVLQATVAKVRLQMVRWALQLLELLETEHMQVVEEMIQLEVEGPEELAQLFELILSKALNAPMCAEACTEMLCGLRERYPCFDGEEEEVKVSSTRILLNIVQYNYEKLFSDDPNEQAGQRRKLDRRFSPFLTTSKPLVNNFEWTLDRVWLDFFQAFQVSAEALVVRLDAGLRPPAHEAFGGRQSGGPSGARDDRREGRPLRGARRGDAALRLRALRDLRRAARAIYKSGRQVGNEQVNDHHTVGNKIII